MRARPRPSRPASARTLPVYVTAAGGGIIVDADGNQLIDFGAGIAVVSVGNAAPRVVEAVQQQVAAFTHTCFMVTPYEGYVAVAEKLNELTPGDHDKRSRAVQLRCRGRGERRQDRAPPHRTAGGRRVRPRLPRPDEPDDGADREEHAVQAPLRAVRRRDLPHADGVPVPLADRPGELRGRGVRAVRLAAAHPGRRGRTAQRCWSSRSRARAGSSFRPPGFLARVAEWCANHGILFIADEIQTGFCRTGDWFACEHEQVVPDLITTAKGIAGGMPLAGVTGRAEIMDSVHGGGLGGTYGGNPVACAAALGAIETMQAEDLAGAARRIESIMRPRLDALAAKYDVIGEVRGRGAMLALELVEPGTLTPNPALTGRIAAACHQQGLVTLTAGSFGNVLRFLPPLVIGDDLLNEGLDILEAAFRGGLSAARC